MSPRMIPCDIHRALRVWYAGMPDPAVCLGLVAHVAASSCLPVFLLQTNKTTSRIFPAVLDCENPEFERRLDQCVVHNEKLIEIAASDAPAALKNLQKLPPLFGLISEILALYLMKPVDSGSVDFMETEPTLVY